MLIGSDLYQTIVCDQTSYRLSSKVVEKSKWAFFLVYVNVNDQARKLDLA